MTVQMQNPRKSPAVKGKKVRLTMYIGTNG
jgi:hypothetical protein